MCGFWSFTCGAIPFLLFTLRVLSFSSLSVLLPRGVLCPASLLPEFRSALFPLRPLARHLMPVVPFGGIFAAGSLNVHCAAFLNVHCAGYYPAFFSAPPQTTIRLPSVSSSFLFFPLLSSPSRHPFTSRRCTGELVPFRNMLGSLACSFFAVLSVHFSRILARASVVPFVFLFLVVSGRCHRPPFRFLSKNLHIPNIFCTFAPEMKSKSTPDKPRIGVLSW